MKLGKLPATTDRRDLRFSAFHKPARLPKPPRTFGHETLVGPQWGMLANDKVGDCVWAGACHEHMLWCAEAGKTVRFDDSDALDAYSFVTGYNPARPDSDQGTNVRDALNYRRQTGIYDAAGNLHKIGAFLKLEPGNTEHLYQALYLFGAVGIGIEFPASAFDQFDSGMPWKPVRGASTEGGHYVSLVARRQNPVCVTWGAQQQITVPFLKKYNDESWAILCEDMLTEGKTLEGFDLPQLQEALADL